jgi:hypothetical protein
MLFRGITLVGLIALAVNAGCGGCKSETFPDAAVPDAHPVGKVSLSWTVVDLAGNPLGCEVIGATTVSLQLRNTSGVGGLPESFSCGNSPSTTRQFESGTYSVSIELRSGDGALVSVPDQMVMIAGGQVKALAAVEFRVDPRGKFALSIATPPGTSNCKSPPQGAGITAMTITVKDRNGSCAAGKLLRSRGSTTLPPYTVDCGSPQTVDCIENDETLTPEMPLASGPYTIEINGRVGSDLCFSGVDTVPVPAQGKVVARTQNLANLCLPRDR